MKTTGPKISSHHKITIKIKMEMEKPQKDFFTATTSLGIRDRTGRLSNGRDSATCIAERAKDRLPNRNIIGLKKRLRYEQACQYIS